MDFHVGRPCENFRRIQWDTILECKKRGHWRPFEIQLCAAWPDGAAGRRVRVADVTWRALRATVDYLYGKPLRQGELDTLGFEEAAFLLEVRLVERGVH